ncbi:N-acetylglutamate synthase, CG3035 family [Mycobacterium sp.]|uniref:N-acetylglutamate synthase, CG3035 family n=1 Tax=Mycobacterium sp. TaxID=1785 RepID=UPI003D0E9240
MVSWPELGTRVSVRYRRPAGSVPPLTDVIGHLLETTPLVRVQTKAGEVVHFAPEDAVTLRALSDTPVRASEIRALEHADAMAWPGVEQHWLDGWLLRAGYRDTYEANSAVPLERFASHAAIPAIVDWYRSRDLTPRLSVADRLLRLPDEGEGANWVLVRDVHPAEPDRSVRLQPEPSAVHLRDIPIDELTAVAGGELIFGTYADAAAARATVTDSPDGTRWVGLSTIQTTADPDAAHAVCEAVLAWGASRGATRAYLRVRDGDRAAAGLARSLGFVLHHHARFITVAALT